MNLIVCDTGPIFHLTEAGYMKLLQKTGKVCITKIVDNEIATLFPQWKKDKPGWIFIESLCLDEVQRSMSLFHFI